ncbi:meiotically up-regulated protein [Pedobacter quisquiliarum]|jgi:meiotically up-regulated gene 157 (Mug157) protein|uniref:Meiotically up-regulated protein n=1 Tax=Pedobacter quisquiliarum TaxID=1834438 RepID=A0A916U7E7_9SPHI|nr:glycoside hydrolase family 125 protein [Pedobacter quisquiliarum]GGC61296.1 meiotically up-regulated protein [Pedobacter quisquiliarum]
MRRRNFIKNTGLLGAGVLASKVSFAAAPDFPVVRVAASERHFRSKAVDAAIKTFQSKVKNPELTWLFENCFPNTLDTTVYYKEVAGRPDTYVITGDIDAMWLRDSSAQVWPYLQFVNEDKPLKNLIAGVINHQTKSILKDPYANAFYGDPQKVGEWKTDHTQMSPGVHERKWEIDSLCYPIRLAFHYWKKTGDKAPFDVEWKKSIAAILKTFKEQQRKENRGPYKFQRQTPHPTDTLPMGGYGFPVKPVGLIVSSFRPSDDATIFPFLIPSNFFAVVSLKQAAEMVTALHNDNALSTELLALAKEVETAIQQHGVVTHPKYGKIYAFEVDGFGGAYMMDDSNVPSLLSLPYLGAVDKNDPIYQNTRKFVLSADNPYYFIGKAAEGIGGPHAGQDMIWPMSLSIRALTSTDKDEIKYCIDTLKKTHGGKGFMHESFHKDDPNNFTRAWFAWSNTLFGELLWRTYHEMPELLKA